MACLKDTVIVVFICTTVFVIETLACSGTELLDCLTPLDNLATEHFADPNIVCRELHKAMDCFETGIRKCPAPENHLRFLRQEFEELRSMCDVDDDGKEGQNVTETESLCSVDDLMECVEPLSAMDMSDLTIACLMLHTAVQCVHKEFDTCPKYLEPYVSQMRLQLQAPLSSCDPYYKPITATPPPAVPQATAQSGGKPPISTKRSPQCHWTEIHNCIWPVDQLLQRRIASSRLLCQEHEKASRCLLDLTKRCPGELAPQLWQVHGLMEQIEMHCNEVMTTQEPGTVTPLKYVPNAVGQRSGCVTDMALTVCLLHNWIPSPSVGRRREPVAQDKVCLMVGTSESCMAHITGIMPSCSPHLENRMASQIKEQKAQCKNLGYPTSNAKVSRPTTIMMLAVTVMAVVLRHFL